MSQVPLMFVNGKPRHPEVVGKAIHFLGTCSSYKTDQLYRAFRRIGADYSVSSSKATMLVVGDGALVKTDENGKKCFHPSHITELRQQYPAAMVVHESEVPRFFTDQEGKSHYVALAIPRPRDDF